MTSLVSVVAALSYFHEMLFDPSFMKTYQATRVRASERKISIPLRFFLAGQFFNVRPEHKARNMPIFDGKVGHPKRIDFMLGKLALEVASRSSAEGLGKLSAGSNKSEIMKLMRHEGKSLLCLIDLEEREGHPNLDFLEDYKKFYPFGRGNWSTYPYHVAYLFRAERQSHCVGPIRMTPKKRS